MFSQLILMMTHSVTVFTNQGTVTFVSYVSVLSVESCMTYITGKLNITVYGPFMPFQIILPCKTFKANIAFELHRENNSKYLEYVFL